MQWMLIRNTRPVWASASMSSALLGDGIGEFWFPKMISSIGLAGSGCLMSGIVLGASALPVMLLHWRRSRSMTDRDNGST
jgi:hypothetical protein